MRIFYPFLALVVAGCATLVGTLELDKRFGNADPARFDTPPSALAGAQEVPTIAGA